MTLDATRHDPQDAIDDTENLPAIANRPADRAVAPYGQNQPSPQVITPTVIHQAYAPQHAHILDPHHVNRLLGAPTRVAPNWLRGLKDVFGHAADHHILPAAGVITMAGVSVWAHSEPYHPLIGGSIIACGAWLVRTATRAHHHHGNNADPMFTKGAATAGVAAMLTGATICAGLGPWAAVAVAAGLLVAYTGWHQWGHHKLERTREFAVALTAAGNTGPASLPPATWAPDARDAVSYEESRLHRALSDLKITGAILGQIRRLNEDVWYVMVNLSETNATNETLARKSTELASKMGVRLVEITPGKIPSAAKITVHEGEDSPLDISLPWPGPIITSAYDPMPLGQFEDGETVRELLARWLVGGTSGKGKSGIVNNALAGSLRCKDLVRIGIDCKAGAPELRAYKPAMFHLADSPEEGMCVLAGIEAVYKYRGNLLVEKDVPYEEDEETGEVVRKWRPEYGPGILLLIEELAELTREIPAAADRIQSLNAVVRYVDIFRIDATQTPSAGVFGKNTDARQNYDSRIGLGARERGMSRLIFGEGAQGDGYRMDRLNLPGKFLIRSNAHERPRIARAYEITDRDIIRAVAQFKDQTPDLDEGSAAAFWEGYNAEAEAQQEGGDDGPRGGKPVDLIDVAEGFHRSGRTLYAVPTYPGTNTAIEAHYRALWDLFIHQSGEASTIDMAAAAKRAGHENSSESWVREALRYWASNGWVESEKRSGTQFFWLNDAPAERKDA